MNYKILRIPIETESYRVEYLYIGDKGHSLWKSWVSDWHPPTQEYIDRILGSAENYIDVAIEWGAHRPASAQMLPLNKTARQKVIEAF